tara:strand:- start:27 stop:281 length:255 start_codon:yes stop_codon:yes gene_type:complete
MVYKTFQANRSDDTEFDIHQLTTSRSQAIVNVVVMAPVLRRLGEIFDSLSNESWAKEPCSIAAASRPALASDAAYRCEQVYTSI